MRHLLPLILCLSFIGIGLTDIFRNSAVADEIGGHMDSGFQYLKTGVYNGGIANFPLAQVLMALPAAVSGAPRAYFSEDQLVLFRLPILLMGILLALALWRFGVSHFGRVVGIGALGLYCFSPNILAHSTLATIDLPLSLFVFLTIFALRRFLEEATPGRLLCLSFVLGCALTTKIQALLLIPIIVAVLVIGIRDGKIRPRWDWVFLVVIPYVLINLIYLNVPIVSGHLLPPMFMRALDIKLAHAGGRLGDLQTAYLCGRYSSNGWWYYFPAAILFKTPLPTLVLLFIGLARKFSKREILFLYLPIAAFLGSAMLSSVNIGLRHILPIYPFLFLVAGRGAEFLFSGGRWKRAGLGLLAGAYLAQAILIPPHHLSFFNFAVGGPQNGRRYLVDSNLDWGQNDRFLEAYLCSHPGKAFQIDPDPFHPSGGSIAVNVNAYYGIYGGGREEAYSWLKGREPDDIVSCTWLIFDPPMTFRNSNEGFQKEAGHGGNPDLFRLWTFIEDPVSWERSDEVLRRHLRALEVEFPDLSDPAFRFQLARAYIALTSYGDAIANLRFLMRAQPSFRPALGLGSELMVRWKLGMLRFGGRQYLEAPRPSALPLEGEVPDFPSVLRAGRRLRLSTLIARVHRGLGQSLIREGRDREGRTQSSLAFALDPSAAVPGG